MINTARIFLVGMMGSGKSTTAAELALLVGFDHLDTDDMLVEDQGPIDAIFAEHGEAAFRLMESAVMTDVLERSRVVVSTGGGLPIFHNNMDRMLKHGTVFYLRTSIPVLLSRLEGQMGQRPLLEEDPESILRRLETTRRDVYEEAHFVLDTDTLTPADAAVAILHKLRQASQ